MSLWRYYTDVDTHEQSMRMDSKVCMSHIEVEPYIIDIKHFEGRTSPSKNLRDKINKQDT